MTAERDEATLADQRLSELLADVGAKTPTPGGGAVASVTAALGAALGLMVVRYSAGRKKLADHAALHEQAIAQLETLQADALALAAADAKAYGRLNALWKLPEDDEQRQRDMPDAVRGAIEVPSLVLARAEETLTLLEQLCGRTNAMLASDLAIAAVLADAAARAAAWNIRINLPMLPPDEAATIAAGTEQRLASTHAACERVEAGCG